MELHLLKGRKRGGYAAFGGVWDKGEVKECSFTLKNEEGRAVPVQSRAMAYWPDGSVKWSSHVADSGRMGERAFLEPAVSREPSDAGNGGAAGIAARNPGCETGEAGEVLSLTVAQQPEGWAVDTGRLRLWIPGAGTRAEACLAEEICILGRKGEVSCLAERAYPIFRMEHRRTQRRCGEEQEIREITEVIESHGKMELVTAEASGPLQAVFCFRGRHMALGEAGMPFVIRLYLWAGSSEMRFVHTFLFDGKEERDYLKGMGIRFDTRLTGSSVNRHIQYVCENRVFHEAAVMLNCNYPRLSPEVFRSQMQGEPILYGEDGDIAEAAANMPVWNRYRLIQDSAYHFGIRKQTKGECCELSCRQGSRSRGVMSVSGEQGGLTMGIRDFWQKYPGELEATGLGERQGSVTAWFYSPACEAYDFRHYDTRSYSRSCYEGFENVGADARGIGVTSQCTVRLDDRFLTEKEILFFGERVQKPCVYVGTPEYYHEKRAFGYWSLPAGEEAGEQERKLETQLDAAFAFYKQEVENRDWYGLFDYGDVMHSYDRVRHTWKYDVGGFAWQNTELVDTYWLWLYFLRTGREDVFTMAEAMSRHCSEVDIYHFGPLQGLGSRHNVRHWGCSCKEPRIGMAGHHRFLYYLTADERLGDVMEDVRDADLAMSRNCRSKVKAPDGRMLPGARSGPDWSSYVSNWMTHYERTLEERYRQRIEAGIGDIAASPYGFASGPDYLYDADTGHLVYNGEVEDTPNQHLQICMGGPQVWLETADMLEDDTLKRLLADLGSFYYLSPEEKSRRTKGEISKRPFSWPFMAAGVTAFAAHWNRDQVLARQTWEVLWAELAREGRENGFVPEHYGQGTERDNCQEIPWISTNTVSQWCLNVMMGMEFIREYLE